MSMSGAPNNDNDKVLAFLGANPSVNSTYLEWRQCGIFCPKGPGQGSAKITFVATDKVSDSISLLEIW
jgi:hypothetical protein